MFSHLRPVWAEIDLDNLAHNMREIRRVSKAKDIITIIKADAYGHGALDMAPILMENGATMFAVATLSEAIELRKGGIKIPIIILGYTPLEQFEQVLEYDIEQTVFSFEYAKEISEIARRENKTVKLQIKVDTGMGRIGFLPNDKSIEDVYQISLLPNIQIEGLFSHFSSADEEDKEYTYLQLQKFNWFAENLNKKNIQIKFRHIANSSAIIDLPESHFEAVRAGIIIYGYYPSEEVSKQKIDLKPVMSIKVNVTHIKKIPAGEYISYGRKFKTDKESIIATLPIGYADGYTRLLSNKAKVIIKGQFAPVVGRICMDMCMVDITHIEGVKNGDEVIVIGEDHGCRFNADDIAEMIGTINYEVLCMISKRVPRVYIKDKKVVKIRNYV